MPKTILIADDEPDVLKIISLRLQKAGYETISARDGRETLDLARQMMPDLIILDVYLPDINGDDIARTLKRDKKLMDIPVILISATVTSVASRAEDCGAVGSIAKPFEPEDLVGMVKKVLSDKKGAR